MSKIANFVVNFKPLTRPDTRLPQSRAGGQGPYLRSLDHLGRSSEAKDRKKQNKTRPDTRQPKSRAVGQGPYLRSLDHLGRSSEVKEKKT